MSLARIRFGLPLGGIDRENRVAVPPPSQPGQWSVQDLSGWRFDMARNLMPLPTPAAFADTPDANPVTRMHNIRFGDDTAAIVRHTHTGFFELASGVWTDRTLAGSGFPTTAGARWGAALVISPTSGSEIGKGHYMFSNGAIGPFIWTGSGDFKDSGEVGYEGLADANPAKHIVSFADRAMLFNIDDGNTRGRTGQWSIAGDAATSGSWTGTGSGNRDFTELEGEITGVGIIRRSLFVYSRTGIVGGVETFDAENPVSYGPVVTNGVGLWAPGSLLSYNDIHAFLSEEGFKTWDGSQFLPIGSMIDTHILSRINRDAIDTVCGFVKPDWSVIFWALPMDSASTPNEGWFYDYKRQSWHRVDLGLYLAAPPRSFTTILQASGEPWNNTTLFGLDPIGGGDDVPWSGFTGTWLDFRGAASRPTVLTGLNDGSTYLLDESQTSTSLLLELETPDLTWEGTPVYDELANFPRQFTAGRPVRVINADTVSTLDQIEFTYRTISGSPTFYILVSEDGGENFRAFGSVKDGGVSFVAGTGEKVRRVRVHGRASGSTLRVKMTNKNPATGTISTGAIHLEDIIFTIRESGEVRSVA